MSNNHQSAGQAADAIIALINSRTRSPTRAELVAIVTEGSSPPPIIDALLERVSDMEKAIWTTPATTLADVLLRAEIAENNENGMMDDLDNPDAYLDDRAMAQLTRAVLDVLGGHHAS